LRFTSALIREDFPTFDFPAMATSGKFPKGIRWFRGAFDEFSGDDFHGVAIPLVVSFQSFCKYLCNRLIASSIFSRELA